jgi:hypothetical protein
VTGNWRVTYHFVTNPNLATNVMGVLRLRQTGTSVVGLFQPPNGATAIPITGAVAGHLLTLTVGPVVTGPGTVMTISSQTMVDATGQTASGTVNATSLSGMTSQQLSGTADLNRQP